MEWMHDGCKVSMAFLCGIKWIMLHGYLDYFQKPPLGGRPNTKPQDHGTPNAHNGWFILFYRVWRPAWIEFGWGPGHIWLHTILEGPWPHYMILVVSWDGIWTLSIGLSWFHGHGSWLMCEVALRCHSNLRYWFIRFSACWGVVVNQFHHTFVTNWFASHNISWKPKVDYEYKLNTI